MSLSQLLSQIRALSLEERIRLVQAVWDDIAAEQPTIELSDSFKAELNRRIAADEVDPTRAVSWEDVQAQAERRLPR